MCSDGSKISQAVINARLSDTYRLMSHDRGMLCECCGEEVAEDHDHTISQKRCKQLHKSELIFDPDNISMSCRDCHQEFERYKSGAFEEHKNAFERMKYMKQHDEESFRKRMMYVSHSKILQLLND